MAAPVRTTCTNGSWTKVATDVTYGQIGFDIVVGVEYLVTYVLTGSAAPSDLTTAHPVKSDCVYPISADEGIDVYVYCRGLSGNGAVLVEV